MAMEFTVYSLNGLLLCCLRSKYEPEIFYETKITGLQRPLYEEMYGQLMAGGKQFVHCREVVLLSECPLYRRFYCIYSPYHSEGCYN